MSKQISNYKCAKCGCTNFIQDQIQTTGGMFSKIFDVQNKKYVAISCKQCGYTEFYRTDSSVAMNILDFLLRNK